MPLTSLGKKIDIIEYERTCIKEQFSNYMKPWNLNRLKDNYDYVVLVLQMKNITCLSMRLFFQG